MIKEYLKCLLIFAKIGISAFGGGYSMLPLLQGELVTKRHWLSEEELSAFLPAFLEEGTVNDRLVVLPVANFDAYFGTTSFGRKYLKQIPEPILERSETGFGLCRYRLGEAIVIE